MNIYDISRRAGVSIATVSRVLNGSGKVSEATRQKILSIIEETGYTPNAFARGLGLNTMHTIGILCADSSDSFLALAIYLLEQGLRAHGYDSLLCCTGYDPQVRRQYLDLLLSKRVDAVILVGSNFVEAKPEYNQYILDAAREIPVVIVNGYLEGPQIYCSLCDDYEALHLATTRFAIQGRKRLLYLYRTLSYSGRRKLAGFEDACRSLGLPQEQFYSACVNGTIYETRDYLKNLWEQRKFDAILTSDDEMAIGALKFARVQGLSVPQDLSILGYNNSKLGLCCDPELSTVDNQLGFACTSAISLLTKALAKEPVPSRIILSGQILHRGTTDRAFAQVGENQKNPIQGE
ncbi:MAG: LacI family transcriptional regulator [Lachnospiraceae bacterium]|nr:LacI family transcriptional regulator [Lachnospiraceae bacterium]